MAMILFPRGSTCLLALAAMISFNAHAQSAASPAPTAATPAPVATVDEVVLRGPAGQVTAAQVRAAVNFMVPLSQREGFFANPRNIEQLAISIYTRQTLAEQAKKQGFDRQEAVAQVKAIAEQQAISDMWIANKMEGSAPTDAQLEKYARSAFNAQPTRKKDDGQAADFDSQRAALMEQAKLKLMSQARVDLWNAAQSGAQPDANAISKLVQPEPTK